MATTKTTRTFYADDDVNAYIEDVPKTMRSAVINRLLRAAIAAESNETTLADRVALLEQRVALLEKRK